MDTRTGGKGAGDSTSSGDREKQLGGDPMEVATKDTNTSQMVVEGTPVEPEPVTERDS